MVIYLLEVAACVFFVVWMKLNAASRDYLVNLGLTGISHAPAFFVCSSSFLFTPSL